MLIQSSLSTIPNYNMQCAYLPSKVLDGIDRISKNFLWGSTYTSKKMHWVGWHKVTRPRKEGGLGLQSAKGRNTSLLAKLNWRFHSEKILYGPEFLGTNTALVGEQAWPTATNFLVPEYGKV